jgi:hypothetical protein
MVFERERFAEALCEAPYDLARSMALGATIPGTSHTPQGAFLNEA